MAKKLPEIPLITSEANPWGVPLLDVRPITHGMLSMSRDPKIAANAISFQKDDGTGFIGVKPQLERTIDAALQYPIDRYLADGVLFTPSEMEHKWAIYLHRGKIIFIRSWLRQVIATADIRATGDVALVTRIHGAFSGVDEDPAFAVRVADFLIRTHALDLPHPVPLPAGMESDPSAAGLWCMNVFGKMAAFATPHFPRALTVTKPLRTNSLLHIAVARNDGKAALAQLDAGVPIDLLAADGLAPLHWALTEEMIRFLLNRGSPVDVRSDEGATPLMMAVQEKRPDQIELLLSCGADANAGDHRGFTALHRAAEAGLLEIVRQLLSHGAKPDPVAQGHTPLSLATARNQKAVAELLSRKF